ncbi:unnamed protein product [Echinostoma caproni]|uniref:Uncharacterized protein n=1 Tax=Echinostoma caproni TaxID=27848 RepID=A0A183A502_9TREM|nr:unnamed protein product [Echinostoma caproni]
MYTLPFFPQHHPGLFVVFCTVLHEAVTCCFLVVVEWAAMFVTCNVTQLDQQSILDFFEQELIEDAEVDSVLLIETRAKNKDDSPVFELDWERAGSIEPAAKRGRVTNLFDQAPSESNVAMSVAPDRLLVAATPETSPDKEDALKAGAGETPTVAQADATLVNLEEDDTFLLAAAEAAEVAWLTEGLALLIGGPIITSL